METKKPEIVSDKAEKQLAARLIKEGQSEMFSGVDATGRVAKGYPLAPVGSAVFLKWNLAEDSKIIVKDKQRKPISNLWEVVGVGGNVKTVAIGNKLVLKATADVEGFSTEDMDELPTVRYHIIYEHAISAIVVNINK